MRIKVNGAEREVPAGSTVEDFLAAAAVPREYMALELNRKILRKALFTETPLTEGDVIEIVNLVGGG